MGITLVTTTRDRAFCFSLLERWMDRQKVQFDQWLVINDGQEEYNYTMGQEVVLRDPIRDTIPSICANWTEAIPRIKHEKVLCIEDDDWYHREYVGTMSALLDEVDLAGVSHDVYFKLPSRKFMRMHNVHHASLASTGFRAQLLPNVERICQVFKNIFIDMILWQDIHQIGGTYKLIPQPRPDGRMLHIGMKNMPGCAGLGLGHQNPHSGSTDYNFETFAKWAGYEASGVYRLVWRDYFSNYRH